MTVGPLAPPSTCRIERLAPAAEEPLATDAERHFAQARRIEGDARRQSQAAARQVLGRDAKRGDCRADPPETAAARLGRPRQICRSALSRAPGRQLQGRGPPWPRRRGTRLNPDDSSQIGPFRHDCGDDAGYPAGPRRSFWRARCPRRVSARAHPAALRRPAAGSLPSGDRVRRRARGDGGPSQWATAADVRRRGRARARESGRWPSSRMCPVLP